jgi:HEAT repeat protein
MTELLAAFARLSPLMAWAAVVAAFTMAAAVVVERAAFGVQQALSRHVTRRYLPLVQRALAGDETARGELLRSPARHRLALARLLIEPLIEDRDPERIARTRALAEAMSVFPLAERYLRSWMWWRRALALRALGLVQARDHTAQLIAALDDPHPDVRAAALDALADQHDPAALQAVIVRLHDTSLHRGRRGAALKAFGSDCEPFLLDWSEVDPQNRLNYIHAIAICGTALSRPALCRWTRDARVEVRATAFEALAYVGLDDDAARVAVEGLESDDPPVRAMAAYALRDWQGPGDAAARLAPHLDDTWPVAVRAARTLRSMGEAGLVELQARASGQGLGGLLARQMLWQAGAHR